jgi:ABC-type sugar transport system substrate-binding protein
MNPQREFDSLTGRERMREISRRTLIKNAAALGAVGTFASTAAFAANTPPQIGIVAKIRIPWFDNVEKGIKKAAADPSDPDAIKALDA